MSALFILAAAQGTQMAEPQGAAGPQAALVFEPAPVFDPKSYAVIGEASVRFETIWEGLAPPVREAVDEEARRIWLEDLSDEEKAAVREAARTLYADLSPQERRALKEERARLWLDMPPIDRIRAQTNAALAFTGLPEAYQNGFRAEALRRVDPAAAQDFFGVGQTDETPTDADLLDRLDRSRFERPADGGD